MNKRTEDANARAVTRELADLRRDPRVRLVDDMTHDERTAFELLGRVHAEPVQSKQRPTWPFTGARK